MASQLASKSRRVFRWMKSFGNRNSLLGLDLLLLVYLLLFVKLVHPKQLIYVSAVRDQKNDNGWNGAHKFAFGGGVVLAFGRLRWASMPAGHSRGPCSGHSETFGERFSKLAHISSISFVEREHSRRSTL